MVRRGERGNVPKAYFAAPQKSGELLPSPTATACSRCAIAASGGIVMSCLSTFQNDTWITNG
jgi:hypothetical protein